MSDQRPTGDDDGFGQVLAEYFTRQDQGERVAREAFLAAHPDHADALRAYFADADRFGRLASGGAPHSPAILSISLKPSAEFGGYELLEELGRGGMGIVYKVREQSTGRHLALKMLLAGLFASPRDIERFRNEAQAAANLRHPAIVPIYHVGEHQGHLFYTMPLVEGTNLARRLAQSPFDPRAAAELIAAVAEAVDYAHSQGVIHRDLKPANILLDAEGKPYVADFGLARRLGEEMVGLTATGDMVGTPNYMAPEQVQGRHAGLGAATDVYALGAVLYAMLVGRAPFQSETVAETLQRICSDEPPRPRQARRTIPPDLETICLKCLEKPTERRYASAGELAEDLRRFLAGKPIAARPVGNLERSRRWFARNPVVGSLAVGVGVALVAGTCFSTYYAIQARAHATEAHAREQQALANLYVADMNLAQQYADSGWIASSLNVLEKHRPAAGDADRRGWEWHYGWRQCHGELRRFEGQKGAVHSAAFSLDGRLLAAGCADSGVYVWETATGALLHALRGHEGPVRGVAFSPDGCRVASVGDDRKALVWDATTGTRLAVLEGGEHPLTTVAWSSDGSLLAATGSSGQTVHLWNATGFKPLRTFDLGPAEQIAFSPDGKTLALAGRDGVARVCRTDDGKIIATLKGHKDVVHGLAISSDGVRLATAGTDRTVRIWDTHSWSETARYSDFRDAVWRVAFSPDGRRLAAAGRSDPVKVRDIEHPETVAELRGHTALVTAIAFCPTDDRLVTASEDGTLRLWDASRSTQHDSLVGHLGAVATVAFSPNGRLLASAGEDSSVILWDAVACRPLRVMRSNAGHVRDIAFSPGGARIAAAEEVGHLRVWDAATGRDVIGAQLGMGPLRGVAFSPNGKLLAVGSATRTIKLLDAGSGKELAGLAGHVGGLGRLAFNPQGTLLASCGADRMVRLWQIPSGTLVNELPGHTATVVPVAFSPDGRWLASASNDRSIRVWDVASGQLVRVITGHGGSVYSVVFGPDGRRLISGSVDRTVKIWDVETGQELQTLEGNTDWVRDVAMSPDGNLIASAGSDHLVRIWDARLPSHELLIEREAAAVVRVLAVQHEKREPTVEAIRSLPTISAPVREAALRQAHQYLYHWDTLLAAHAAAERRDWPTAADAFEQVADLAPDDLMHWHWLAMASLGADRRDRYDRACDAMLTRLHSDARENEIIETLVAWLVVPHDPAKLVPLGPHSERLLKQIASGDYMVLYLYDLRMGRKPHLVDPGVLEFVSPGPQPEHAYNLALALLFVGDLTKAREAYAAGLRLERAGFGAKPWWTKRLADTLRQELEAGLEAAEK